MVLDGGDTRVGLESTIVDLSDDEPKLLRPGAITLEMLEEVIGRIAVHTELAEANEAPKSPGMKYKHYAPSAGLTIVKCKNAVRLVKYIRSQIENDQDRLAVIAPEESLSCYSGLKTYPLRAEGLFSVLRKIDEDGIEGAYIHSIDECGIGLAIMNRLKKAAGNNIIDLDKLV
jgi:L-threonylcarbamoyladenylate synthase